LVLKLLFSKIQQDGESKSRGAQIIQSLCAVSLAQIFGCLYFENHNVVDYNVCEIVSDDLCFEIDAGGHLLSGENSLAFEQEHEGVLVDLLEESISEFPMNFHCKAHNPV